MFDAGSQSAETALGGVRMDSIPKEGGNRFSGAYRFFFSNGALQNDNVPDDLLSVHQGRRLASKIVEQQLHVRRPDHAEPALVLHGVPAVSQTDSYVADMVLPDGRSCGSRMAIA